MKSQPSHEVDEGRVEQCRNGRLGRGKQVSPTHMANIMAGSGSSRGTNQGTRPEPLQGRSRCDWDRGAGWQETDAKLAFRLEGGFGDHRDQ